VDAVRRALSELTDLEAEIPLNIKGRIPKITRLLQDVEGHLEAEDSASLPLDYAKKIIFSPADSVSKLKSFDDSFTADADSDLPIDAGTPTGKHVLKVYMNNQLELQQSEWEKYEEAFNTLDEKLAETENQLQVVTEERDSLLQQLQESRQNLSDQQSAAATDETITQLMRELESTKTKLMDLESEYDKLSEVLHSPLHPSSSSSTTSHPLFPAE
jgi:DNA repair exonuclease SbcCD ATPase subunit